MVTDSNSDGSGAVAAPVRRDIDLRTKIASQVWFQGARPLCGPISLSQAHEAISPDTEAMAPEAIWWACSKLGQTSADGMLLVDAGRALRLGGQPLLARWPWNPNLGVDTEDPPQKAGTPPWNVAELVILQLAHDGQEDGIENALEAGYPVVLNLELTQEFDDAASDGSINLPDIRNPPGDYHAVVIVGAASDNEHGRRFLIKNSWGDHWGAGGYGWLPVDYLVANAVQAAIVRLPNDEQE